MLKLDFYDSQSQCQISNFDDLDHCIVMNCSFPN